MTPRGFGQQPSWAVADFVTTTPPDLIPSEVTARLRRLVLDWIGIAAFAGHYAENAGPLHAAAVKLDAGAGAPSLDRGKPVALSIRRPSGRAST